MPKEETLPNVQNKTGIRQMSFFDGEQIQIHIEKRLKDRKPGDTCVLFRIVFEGKDGQAATEESLRSAGRSLSALFRASDIIGLEEDHIFIFLSGRITRPSVFEKANMIVERLTNLVYREYSGITMRMGIYLSFGGAAFKNLNEGCEKALAHAKKENMDFYIKTDPMAKEVEKPDPVNAITLHGLLQNMSGGVCLLEIGEDIRVLYANAGFCRMLGRKPGDFGLPCLLREIGLHPDYEAEYEDFLRRGMDKKDGIRQIQRIRHENGTWVWRQVRTVRLFYPDHPLPLMMEISTDISELIEKGKKLRESNERLRVAFEQTPHLLWEIDIKNKTARIFDVNQMDYDHKKTQRNFPDSFLENGIIHPDSAEDFRKFAAGILAGNPAGNGNFIVRDMSNGCYEWLTLSYHMCYDESGAPVKAIGVQEKLPSISGINYAGFSRRGIPEVLRHHLLCRLQVNLSTGAVEYLWNDGLDKTAWTWGKSYRDILEAGEDRLFIQGAESEFSEIFKRENLLKAYQSGKKWFTGEFRRIAADGSIRWMEVMVNLEYIKNEKNVHMFACFVDCQQRKEWEHLLPEEWARTKKGSLYALPTMMEFTKKLIERENEGSCAMACIEIRGGKKHAWDNEALDDIFTAMTFCFGPDCIAGKYKRNGIFVYFPKIHSKFGVKRRIEDAFAYIRMAMYDIKDLDSARFIAGVVVKETREADAENLRIHSSCLCGIWKNAAMDTVAFPNDDEWDWMNMKFSWQDAKFEEEKKEVLLSRAAADTVLECVTSMLMADSLETSMRNALRSMGKYYQANRVYMLAVSDNKKEITMIHEWVKNGKSSIRQIMSGMQIQKVPLLVRCQREGKTMIMKSPSWEQGEGGYKDYYWRFIAVPLKEEEEVRGFLCVENARVHTTETALLNSLLPYLLNEYKRFRSRVDTAETRMNDTLSRIPNLRNYTDVIYSMTSDIYSSMGAVAMDIPNYSAINGKFSFEYGREMLGFIVETLTGLFGKGLIFRTWDAEFVALVPNTILEVFVGRCTRLRTMMQRRYPHEIRIGYTWSDGVFNGKKLVKEAKSIMRCEEVREAPPDKLGLLEGSWPHRESPVSGKSYLLYLQPKVDLRDGSLVGAEALVRGIDEKGNIIPPGQFIEELEKNGGIRDLDFYMLESVLRQLSRWKKQGLKDVDISVNISRFTLLNPTVLASVLAIFSHYPEIPAEQVELEITETAGDVEKSTLGEIVKSFRECGIGFELDDFGSRYANMSIFSNIKFKTIKLDKSLINDLPGNEISRMLVKNIAEICETFGMKCIAEGVETEKQKEALLNAGCQYGQGFYYARPMPAWKFEEEYLNTRN